MILFVFLTLCGCAVGTNAVASADNITLKFVTDAINQSGATVLEATSDKYSRFDIVFEKDNNTFYAMDGTNVFTFGVIVDMGRSLKYNLTHEERDELCSAVNDANHFGTVGDGLNFLIGGFYDEDQLVVESSQYYDKDAIAQVDLAEYFENVVDAINYRYTSTPILVKYYGNWSS